MCIWHILLSSSYFLLSLLVSDIFGYSVLFSSMLFSLLQIPKYNKFKKQRNCVYDISTLIFKMHWALGDDSAENMQCRLCKDNVSSSESVTSDAINH